MFKRFFLREENMLIAIIINSIIIFALHFPSLRDNPWLEYIDHFFIALFTLEAIIKIRSYGWKTYWAGAWNRFDFILVMGSIPSLLTGFLPVPDTSLLIVFRLFRLLRLVRFLRFVPGMSKIIAGLGRAIKASVFVVIALVFLNILLSLMTCEFYGDIAPEHFGNPFAASYSIFQLFTVEGWNEIAQSVAERTEHPWLMGLTRFYFVLIVLLGGIFGMSLANAVFVDEMTMDNNDIVEAKIDRLYAEIQELKEMLAAKER